MTALLIILAVIGVIVLLVVVRRKNGSVDVPEPQDTVFTPGEVMVYSNVAVPNEVLLAIDEGIAKTIERMPAEWTGGRDLGEYEVRFVAPDGFGSQGNPYVLRGGIPAWGYVEGISTDPSGKSDYMVIVMPYQQDWAHPEWVSGTAWSESEHIVERLASIQLNDPEIFWKWQRDGALDVHPHRP